MINRLCDPYLIVPTVREAERIDSALNQPYGLGSCKPLSILRGIKSHLYLISSLSAIELPSTIAWSAQNTARLARFSWQYLLRLSYTQDVTAQLMQKYGYWISAY